MKTDKQKHTNSGSAANSSRRLFLRNAGVAAMSLPAVSSILPATAYANSAAGLSSSGRVPMIEGRQGSPAQGGLANMNHKEIRRLHLYNDHTGDEYNVTYYIHGIYHNESVSLLNHLMRDRRANLATLMDTTLYDQLYLLHKTLGATRPVHILSGYRTAKTNAKLRSRSTGVAKYSLHMEGRAADMYIPGFTPEDIRSAAVSLEAGGVGLYSTSGFVHLDTGPVRHWGS